MRKKKNKNKKHPSQFLLPEETKKMIGGVLMVILALILTLSFFNLAGLAGKTILTGLTILIGRAVFVLPFILVLAGLIFFVTTYQKILKGIGLAILILIFGLTGFFESSYPGLKLGGYFGYLAGPLLKLFGFLVTKIIFGGTFLIGGLIFWHFFKKPIKEEKIEKLEEEKKPSFIRKIFAPRFEIKEVEPPPTPAKETKAIPEPALELKPKLAGAPAVTGWGAEYQLPPWELLDSDRGQPTAGDIRINATIIKKTLESFEIPVEMSEVNIGPTVTQYTLKPANGIKLSKITSLSNDLALALASHPIRIEAPIPGKPLVGIEIPNKIRALVRLRDLIQHPQFQKASSNLTFCLGRDVSGNPIYADLARMPHLLVAGATGTGKTIFLNNLMLSLLYRNSPEILRFILIDPKRVEFPIYNLLPHLLCPVIFDAQKTVNALKWLTEEMEKRFGLLAEVKARDIASFNEQARSTGLKTMPYIVLIIDELADLMAARGRDVEAGIVRIAQMARAVGIHLVVATQRPSVEVITGLIKANITSRITFQVASQVDSRTVLDMAGAEKLLGLGDMLFVSAEIVKPKRIQAAYVSEREVKRVVNWIKSKAKALGEEIEKSKIGEEILINRLAEDLEKSLVAEGAEFEGYPSEEDPLYEEAKKVVREARKASASLLQRKLSIGYARAARLIDRLEERGVVGPSQGAKPREVYLSTVDEPSTEGEEEDWQKL